MGCTLWPLQQRYGAIVVLVVVVVAFGWIQKKNFTHKIHTVSAGNSAITSGEAWQDNGMTTPCGICTGKTVPLGGLRMVCVLVQSSIQS